MTNKINMIVVDADGEIITAANGHVSSDNPELVKIVKRSVFLPWSVQLVSPFGRRVRPSLDPENLIGITAALFSARPGRTKLLEAPPEVMEWFRDELSKRGGGCIPNNSRKTSQLDKAVQLTDEEIVLLSDPEFYTALVREGEQYDPHFAEHLQQALKNTKDAKGNKGFV